MQKSFLLNTDKAAPASAMPQYRNAGIITVFQQPSNFSVSEQIEPNQVFSLMGFSDSWWHLLVTLDSGTYSCFVRAGAASLYLVEGDSVPQLAHISNPDNSDRLNLRASPSKSAKSLGKYYNGAVASVLGFSEDGEWVRVDVYGRQGYMQRRYLTLEGDGPNSTRIGIPRVQDNRAKHHVLRRARHQDRGAHHARPGRNGGGHGRDRRYLAARALWRPVRLYAPGRIRILSNESGGVRKRPPGGFLSRPAAVFF